jgi:hypothetical protein
MPIRMLVLTALCASTLATAQADGGPRRGMADAGTKGTTVPDRPPPPPGRSDLPAPRTQTTSPVGTGSETSPPGRPPTTSPEVPRPTTQPEVPSPAQPSRPVPH